MTRGHAFIFALLAAGAAALPGTALAAPSPMCTEADNGTLDITGTLPSTITLTKTTVVGETYIITLQGGVTNSLLIVDGNTLFSGQTTGTRSFTATTTSVTFSYDIQGTGAMRWTCTEVADPDPDPPDDPDDPDDLDDNPEPPKASTPEKTTGQIIGTNSPTSGVRGGGGGGMLLIVLGDDWFGDDPMDGGLSCPPGNTRESELATLNNEIEALVNRLGLQTAETIDAQERIDDTEDELVAAGLMFNQLAIPRILARQADARADLRAAEAEIAYLKRLIDLKRVRAAYLAQCAPGGGVTASQFAPTPSYGAASAFARFEVSGTQMLVDTSDLKVWASGSAAFLGGGPSNLAGARGAISVGAARPVGDGTSVGGEIGLAGGRTQIGASSTTADFTALSAMIAMSHELAENVQVSFGTAGGLAWNAVDINGATGSFASGEVSAFAGLSGSHEVNGIVLAPSASIAASHTRSAAYTLSDGTNVGAVSVSSLTASGGLRISMPVAVVERDLILEPFIAFGAGYGLVTGGGLGGPSAGVSAGIDGQRIDGIGFGVSASLSATASGVWSAGVSGRVGGSF